MCASRRKGNGGTTKDDNVPLQAVVLADDFNEKFQPITLERPKVVLPLVNVPMIEYTLEWLQSCGVEEVFVFCCAHSDQVTHYLENSGWFSKPKFLVSTIESHKAASVGDALRSIYERHVIHGDFVLVNGDTVSNMSLTKSLQEHKDRRKKDSSAIMTMITKRSKSRICGNDKLIMGIDTDTKQLLLYSDDEDEAKTETKSLHLVKMLLAHNTTPLSLRNDIRDCYIDICSPELLTYFVDNFDYQHLRGDFVKGLLADEDLTGYKIFTHDIKTSYADRVHNFRSYGSVSKHIIQRWPYPLVLHVDRGSGIRRARSAEIGSSSVIGSNTCIGDNTNISNSVIGEGCTIGCDVSIEGCYVWNNVTIENGCRLRHAVICDGVILKSGAVLNPGVVVSFNGVIGQQFTVPAYSKVSLLEQPIPQLDSDEEEEVEFDDRHSGTVSVSGGVGYIWSVCGDEWKHSVAPIPAYKLKLAYDHDLELELSGEDYDSDHSEDDEDNDDDDAEDDFEKEVEATFLRGVNQNIAQDDIILEVNGLRLSHNMEFEDCAGALFYSIVNLALETPHSSASELYENVTTLITTWKQLLNKYLVGKQDAQIEVLLKFEEMCLESANELRPLFAMVLEFMNDNQILESNAIRKWAREKKRADESDKYFVKKSEKLIQKIENVAADKYNAFEKEVEATFLRSVNENIEQKDISVDVNSLIRSHNLQYEDCGRALFYSIMKLALGTPHSSMSELYQNVTSLMIMWHNLLNHFLVDNREAQIEVLSKFEEMCLELAEELVPLFAKVLEFMNDNNILETDAILAWADEKEWADEADKFFVKKSEKLIQKLLTC